MNANDVVVRIEKIAGNFPKDKREAVTTEVQKGIDEASETSKVAGASEPLTSDEISLIRDGLRTGAKPAKRISNTGTAEKAEKTVKGGKK